MNDYAAASRRQRMASPSADPVAGVDQRGVGRPQGFQCDIGAFEAPAVKLIGERTIETGLDYNPAGLAEAFAFPANQSGILTTLNVYLDPTSTATSVVVGLYANNSGHPGTLLSQTTIAAPANGAWNGVTIAPTAVVNGTKYWLALLGIGGTVRFRDSCCGVSGGRASETSTKTSLTALPTVWGTGTRYRNDSPASFYGTGQP